MTEENKKLLYEQYGLGDSIRLRTNDGKTEDVLLLGCKDCDRMWKIRRRTDGTVAHSDWLPLLNHARKHEAKTAV